MIHWSRMKIRFPPKLWAKRTWIWLTWSYMMFLCAMSYEREKHIFRIARRYLRCISQDFIHRAYKEHSKSKQSAFIGVEIQTLFFQFRLQRPLANRMISGKLRWPMDNVCRSSLPAVAPSSASQSTKAEWVVFQEYSFFLRLFGENILYTSMRISWRVAIYYYSSVSYVRHV